MPTVDNLADLAKAMRQGITPINFSGTHTNNKAAFTALKWYYRYYVNGVDAPIDPSRPFVVFTKEPEPDDDE
jgi:hypothetical protein